MTLSSKNLKKFFALLMWIILISLFLTRHAEPVKDGDVFFHIKYGEYHVQHQTAIADHSIFSWTPAAKYAPYCTWISDIIFYLLFQAGGWPLLFGIKYLCLFFPILAIGLVARKTLGADNQLFTFFVLATFLYATTAAGYLKPELISYVFFALVALLYFHIKSDPDNSQKHHRILFYPVIYLLWANMHGVFVFGLLLLAAITTGEILNFLTNRKEALPKRAMILLIIASLLSVAAVFVTPYGTDLIRHLFHLSTEGLSPNVVSNIRAYQSLFDTIAHNSQQHNLEYWGIMVVLFSILFIGNAIKHRTWDFGIFIPTLLLAMLHVKYIRSTFYWPAFWALSIFYLSAKERLGLSLELKTAKRFARVAITSVLVCLSIYISVRGVYEVFFRPARWLQVGFGYSYGLPVQESAFLKENKLGDKLYNSYNTGSYLLFDHYPNRKVYIDARYFPYKGKIYDDYIDFHKGRVSLKEVEVKFGIDVAVIGHIDPTVMPFLMSDNWRTAFYGTGGFVFIKNSVPYEPDITKLDPHRFDNVKNIIHASDIVRTAQNLDDLETAAYVIGLMETNMSHMTGYAYLHQYCSKLQKGIKAYLEGNHNEALTSLWKVGFNPYNYRANEMLKRLIDNQVQAYHADNNYKQALRLLTYTLKHYPEDANRTYNAGVIAYQASQAGQNDENQFLTTLWRDFFEKFLKLSPDHPYALTAKKLLDNTMINGEIPYLSNPEEMIGQPHPNDGQL